ncbi:MAG: sigma-70 family RNA polymerase sigma factor [Agitococcus sp.]
MSKDNGQQQTDMQLMLAFQAGNQKAFEVLYRRYQQSLMTYLYYRTNDKPLSEEIFQEVWLRIIKASQSYQANAQFNTYLYLIARNVQIDLYRKYKLEHLLESLTDNEPALEVCDYQPNPAKQAQLDQATEQIKLCLDVLPNEQKDIFLLREETGLSLPEIASLIDLPFETVKSRLRYALTKLRQCLAEYY